MQVLEITDVDREIIRFICGKAQDSLIRIHTGKSVYSPKMSLILRKLNLTLEEYEDYSSNAFYDHQLVIEDPERLTQMPKTYLAYFLRVSEVWELELKEQFGKKAKKLLSVLTDINRLTPTFLNLN